MTGGPQTTDSVGEQEGKEGTADTANLDHSADVALDVGILFFVECIKAEQSLEGFGVEGTLWLNELMLWHVEECEEAVRGAECERQKNDLQRSGPHRYHGRHP